MLSFFPRDDLDEIWDLIGSVSEDFPSYSLLWSRMSPENREIKPRLHNPTRTTVKPAFAAVHGPHSLVRIGPGCADSVKLR